MKPELTLELSEEELDTLDEFLASPGLEDTSMDVSSLEGFLTALAIGPRTVMPSEWLPWVWDMDAGEASPEFEGVEQANHILGLIMRHYNAVIRQFMSDPAAFEPIFCRGDPWGAAEWCEGFLLGTQFDQENWGLLLAGQPAWFAPLIRLGTNEGLELIKKKRDAQHWVGEVAPSLINIHAFWLARRQDQAPGLTRDDIPVTRVRDAPKVGRNDPCPCGSGKKYKKCCGPTLH